MLTRSLRIPSLPAADASITPDGSGPACRIPRILHQTYPTAELPDAFAAAVAELKRANPTWEHRFYDDDAVEAFVASCGADMLRYYRRIDPGYGAARADLFRYLLMYKVGGIYLDIKSGFVGPIDETVAATDCYLIARWRNKPGQTNAGFGLHHELAEVPGGEIQQWHIAAAPGHPFLKAVIERVLSNIDSYRPWLHDTGKRAVLRITGPIAYTLAIEPLLHRYKHRSADSEAAFGLRYSVLDGAEHRTLFRAHYAEQARPVIRMRRTQMLYNRLYRLARRGVQWLRSMAPRR